MSATETLATRLRDKGDHQTADRLMQLRDTVECLLADRDDFVNELLVNSPEHYDGDDDAETIALRYLRDLEAVVVALGPILSLWACDHSLRPGSEDPECVRCLTMGPLRAAYEQVRP